jgi:hypothetical protein
LHSVSKPGYTSESQKRRNPRSAGVSQLRGKDSNLDYLIQSQASYH